MTNREIYTNIPMIEFKPLKKDVSKISRYMDMAKGKFCDLSVGVKFMWRDDFIIDYAITDDTLIMKESCPDYKDAFYYPIGDNEEKGLLAIEEYARRKDLPLTFCCLDTEQTVKLTKRYSRVTVSNDRNWSDYIYTASQFKTYSGKKLSGQRNHVNKFKKLYPSYKFRQITQSDFPLIKTFLNEFNSRKTFLMWTEIAEQKKVMEFVENMFILNQLGGLVEVDGKVVAFSIGEKVGDTLIIHLEKALTDYEGAYPFMAQQFALAFADEKIKYINREEDCGDNGLRISKMQYHPLEVKEKNFVKVFTLFDNIVSPVLIKTERLAVTDIYESDKYVYKELYMDDDLNKWWGYDYHEDLEDKPATADYFYNFQEDLKKKKEEYSLAVRLKGRMIGELVLHNFDYNDGVEMGFRFFKEYQNKGYAMESASALKDYVFDIMGAKRLKSRCYKENKPSAHLMEKLGLKKVIEDQTHYYFDCKKK